MAGGIGYINISNLTCKDEQDLENFLASCDKLIIDLRAYPAEYDVLHKLLPTFFFSQAEKQQKFYCHRLTGQVVSSELRYRREKHLTQINSIKEKLFYW